MLHFIRDRAQGWIAWFIVGLISIPFALWGVNSYLNGPSSISIAEVNGESITQTQLQQAVQQYRERMRNMLGENFDPAMFEGPQVKREVLDALIEQQLLTQAANQSGLYISDADVSNIIRNTQAFQRDGQFDSEYYAMVLARAGYTPLRYEMQLRNDLLQRLTTESIQRSAIATNDQVKAILKIEKQKREIAYGVVPVADFTDSVIVDDEAVKNYYKENEAVYTTPEQVKVDYLELSVDELAKQVEVDETALKQFYSENQSKFVGPEQRQASHILIEGDDDEALAKITAIQQQLNEGADFAELAKTESQDTGSAQQGGDLGFFQRDVMDPAFEEAAFALANIGDISEIVKTEFGYHLIKLTGIQQPESQAFSKVKADVEALYRKQQAETLFFDKAELLADLTYENPDNLDLAAEELALEIKTTDNFTRQGGSTELTANDKFVAAAFSDVVLDEELNSDVIELTESHLVVIHKNQFTPSTLLPYDSVAPAIRESLKFGEASEKAKQQGQALLEKLRAGEAVQAEFANWQDAAFYARTNQEVSSQVLQHAFAMPKPVSGDQFAGFTASNGNYIVLQLTAIEEGELSDVKDAEVGMLKGQLAQLYATAEVQSFISALKAEADIQINEQELN
jgi:peptidyl-prolyl cis-trans isomerase D